MRRGAVPTGLGSFFPTFPGLTSWANVFRPFGAERVVLLIARFALRVDLANSSTTSQNDSVAVDLAAACSTFK